MSEAGRKTLETLDQNRRLLRVFEDDLQREIMVQREADIQTVVSPESDIGAWNPLINYEVADGE